MSARVAVTLMVPVPGFTPGIRPMMLLNRMKKKSVPMNGKYLGPSFSPMTSTHRLRTNSTPASATLAMPLGHERHSRREATTNTSAVSTAAMTMKST